MLGTEVDLQTVENNVFAMEMMLKAWLQEQGGDQEHLHLLLPSPVDDPAPGTVADTFSPRSGALLLQSMQLGQARRRMSYLYRALLDIFTRTAEPLILEAMALAFCAVCVKCDMQERLISPVLTPLHPSLRVQTESVADFLSSTKGSANQIQAPHRLRAVK